MKKRKSHDTLTFAVTHIPLHDATRSKLAQLDALAEVYLPLCQQYAHNFCLNANPEPFAKPFLSSTLSQRWQRVAIMQAAGLAVQCAITPTEPTALTSRRSAARRAATVRTRTRTQRSTWRHATGIVS
jgi:hypothetical protein